MPTFALTLIDPAETSLETFDYDDDLWTPTDAAKVTVERYEDDDTYSSVMRFYGNPFIFGDTNPHTGEVFEFGDDGAGGLPIQFGDSWKGVNEGIYKDFTVAPGVLAHLSVYVRTLHDNDAVIHIHALDHTHADAIITGGVLGTWESNEWIF